MGQVLQWTDHRNRSNNLMAQNLTCLNLNMDNRVRETSILNIRQLTLFKWIKAQKNQCLCSLSKLIYICLIVNRKFSLIKIEISIFLFDMFL